MSPGIINLNVSQPAVTQHFNTFPCSLVEASIRVCRLIVRNMLQKDWLPQAAPKQHAAWLARSMLFCIKVIL